MNTDGYDPYIGGSRELKERQRNADQSKRPTVEQTQKQYDALLADIRAHIDTIMGPQQWFQEYPSETGGCGDIPGTLADSPLWAANTKMDLKEWPAFKQWVQHRADKEGFHTVALDYTWPKTGNAVIWLKTDLGGDLQIRIVDAGWSISYATECLDDDDYRRNFPE